MDAGARSALIVSRFSADGCCAGTGRQQLAASAFDRRNSRHGFRSLHGLIERLTRTRGRNRGVYIEKGVCFKP